ncbi:MAG: hypothetical protein CVV13_05485 [Gammaproteobacteria bacterium HGW-Gammaproteobacteria-3]|nr:MAG: hypothetical protein CVV13_05485 [Gammaproteobacteria bacterium HGW-Gammaproteobacteria-3]
MDAAIVKILARADANNLPSIPLVLVDLIEAFQKPDLSFDGLADIIGQDASLSAKVLAAANSSFYRQWGELKDLNRVLVVLGLNTLKTIAMASVVQHFFSQISVSQQALLDVIWHRSLSCAHIARRLARLAGYDAPDEAYLAGLLHRLGQLVLLHCLPKEYPALLNEHSEDIGVSLEVKALGASHNEIAAYLIETWNIRSFMGAAVFYQNQPAQAILDSPPLVKLINLAAQLSRIDAKNEQQQFARAHALFGLNQALIETLLSDIKIEVETTATGLGFAGAKPEAGGGKYNRQEQRAVIQKRLAEHVKSIALLGAISQANELPVKLAKTIMMIQRDMNVLFAFQATVVFLYKPETNVLEACSCGEQEAEKLLSTLSISVQENRSLLASSLMKNQMLDSFSATLQDPAPIIDRQLAKLLAAQGLLVIPLVSGSDRLGVVVVALNAQDAPKIKTKQSLINLFAGQAAAAISMHKRMAQSIQDGMAATRSDFQLHAKKISHEINNPLSIINNYLYLLGMKLGEQSPAEIKLIQEEIQRVGAIVLRLQDAPEDSTSEDNGADINQLVQNLVALFQGGLFSARNIEVQLKLDDKLPLIAINSAKLKQVLTNLVKNASEALVDGGNITLITRDRVYLGSQCCIEIRITDDGPGLSDDIKNNLFKPVTSSKGEGHSGLGLTIVKTLVDELGGTLGCDSNPGEGTTFRVFLPRTIKV